MCSSGSTSTVEKTVEHSIDHSYASESANAGTAAERPLFGGVELARANTGPADVGGRRLTAKPRLFATNRRPVPRWVRKDLVAHDPRRKPMEGISGPFHRDLPPRAPRGLCLPGRRP